MTFFSRLNGIHATLIASALLCSACSSGVTSAELSRVTHGMKINEVETLLGRPTRIDQSEIPDLSGVITGKVYRYSSPQGEARVVLVNDSVFATEFLPEGQHP